MIRVFPRKTKLTPEDDKVYFTGPPLYDLEDKDVWVSVTFIEDKSRGEALKTQWCKRGYDVHIGGPAYDDPGGDFVPGRFVKTGAVMTSRGCNNRCWFCYIPEREGPVRELPITKGFNVLDSNLLQCSEDHVRAVFAMLARQPEKARFTGGLEAAILKDWHCELLADLEPASMFFAYDTTEDWEPLVEAVNKIKGAGMRIDRQKLFVYVLIGYPGDTMTAATKRLKRVKHLGLCPFAMLYQGKGGNSGGWGKFQREWCSPAIIYRAERYSYPLFDLTPATPEPHPAASSHHPH